MSDQVLLTLFVPPQLADPCIELLLEHPPTPPFHSVPGRGHGDDPATLSLPEQVAGSRREVRIEVRIPGAEQDGLLQALRDRFPTPDVRWRVTPILAFGSLAGPEPGTPDTR